MQSTSPPSSPTSPRAGPSRQPHKTSIPSAFRQPPRPKRDVAKLTLRELEDAHAANARLLSSPSASEKESWFKRVSTEQAAIERRLQEIQHLSDVDALNSGLRHTEIIGEDDMRVDRPPSPYSNPMLQAKRKALSQFAPAHNGTVIGSLNMQEAIALEQAAHKADKERHERLLEKRQQRGLPLPGEQLTRQEREARIWAFMNHKPTDSDLEDDSEEEYEDEDPALLFAEDDDDDGRKGQLIVEPDDYDQLSSVIRIDESKISAYNSFYEPHD